MFDVLAQYSPVAQLWQQPNHGINPGKMGWVSGAVGSGRSQLLGHIGLMATLTGCSVLHITTTQSKDELLQSYELLLEQLQRASGLPDLTEQRLLLERFRLIQSRSSIDPQQLSTLLKMLSEIELSPKIILIDGIASFEDPAWKKLALEQQFMLWGLGESSLECADSQFSLSADSNSLSCQLRQAQSNLPAVQLLQNSLLQSVQNPQLPLTASECTLFSGGALGSEAAFGELAEEFGMKEVNFTFEGHNQKRRRGSTMLNDRELSIGSVSLRYVSGKLNRSWDQTSLLQKILHVLWHVVSHADQIFIIGVIQPDNTVHGGTGWSVELARRWSKEVHVFDQERSQWMMWSEDQWMPSVPRITSRNIAGSGTRFMTIEARQAIRALFDRSF